MFDGKTFFPATGIPMRKIACISRLFALAEPVPLTVPILKAKSLMRDAMLGSDMARYLSCLLPRFGDDTRRASGGIRHQQVELSHVPRGGGTTLGAQTAVEANVFVFHHDAFRL